MRLRTLIIATGSTLAFAAPYAHATTTPRLAPAHPKTSTKPAVAQAGMYVAPFPSRPIVTPRYVYLPPDAGNYPVVVVDCQAGGNDCTDDQLCAYWGVNCPG